MNRSRTEPTTLPAPAPDVGQRRSSSDQAALYIRRLIFDGALRPGNRVPQDEVAQKLGISRIPVREALIALEREGWVTIELHRGAFVTAIDAPAIIDHYELYGILYGFAAERALQRGPADLIDRLRGIARQYDDKADADAAGQLSFAFHSAVVEAAGSPRLRVVIRAMSAMVPSNLFALVPGSIDISRRGLNGVLRAMARGDADKVAQEYARLLGRLGEGVLALFRERGLLHEPDGDEQSAVQAAPG
jgi:DNA-binding GntR family transcriptional regulator